MVLVKCATKMNDAAAGITHIIQGLNHLNLTRFLPQSGVTVILFLYGQRYASQYAIWIDLLKQSPEAGEVRCW
jgi:hypothetical protein